MMVCMSSTQLFSDPYHGEFKAVGFWYGETDDRRNLHLTIMKRPDGDLKVWPGFPFPESHVLRRAEPGADDPAESVVSSEVNKGRNR